jgi:hypothetical protein
MGHSLLNMQRTLRELVNYVRVLQPYRGILWGKVAPFAACLAQVAVFATQVIRQFCAFRAPRMDANCSDRRRGSGETSPLRFVHSQLATRYLRSARREMRNEDCSRTEEINAERLKRN